MCEVAQATIAKIWKMTLLAFKEIHHPPPISFSRPYPINADKIENSVDVVSF